MDFQEKNESILQARNMNNEAIHKLAVKISLSHVRDNDNEPKYYHLPIKKICGIPVNVNFVRMANTKEKYIVILDIESKHAYIPRMNRREYLTLLCIKFIKCEGISLIDFYKEIIIKTKEDIKNLKFDKMNGILVEEIEESKEDLVIKIFDECENIEFDCEKCSCCLEFTTTKTKCNHNICVLCWGTLKEEQDEDNEEMKYQKCPICREKMYF